MPALGVALFLSCCLVQMKEESGLRMELVDTIGLDHLHLVAWTQRLWLCLDVPGWTCRQLSWWGPVNSIVPPS
jgi:hypothetical protein